MFLLLMAVSMDRESERIMKFSDIKSKASCTGVALALKIEALFFIVSFRMAEHPTLLVF